MTRDKIQQLARDAGGIRAVEYADPQCFMGNMSFTDQELAAFADLVLEEAAKVCKEAEVGLLAVYEGRSEQDPRKKGMKSDYVLGGADQSDLLADAIRAMKPEA
jgi:hypothetical protein